MSVQSIYNNVATANVNTATKATENKKEEVKAPVENKTGFDETAVVYEKSKETETVKPNKNNGVDREAIIAQIKAEKIVEQIRKNNEINTKKNTNREDFKEKDFEEKTSNEFELKHRVSTDADELNYEVKRQDAESDGEDF